MATGKLFIRVTVDDRATARLEKVKRAIKKLELIECIRQALRKVNGFA